MKINRHTYEEYFLLYIDNELNVEQKKQVELFVQENPDLEEELIMLQQSKLIPESNIKFEDKQLLTKEENDSFINLNNYEEWFVLYVDDELSEQENMEVEKFVTAHPSVHQELILFQQTKLQPGNIVFTNKEVLYKKERATLIRMQWIRVAAAVLLFIAAAITLPFILNKKNNNKRVASVETPKTEIKKEQTANSEKNTKTITTTNESSIVPKTETKRQEVAEATNSVRQTNSKVNQPEKNNKLLALNNSTEKSTTTIETNLPKPITNESNVSTISQTEISNANIASNNLHKEIINNPAVTNAILKTPDNSNALDNNTEYTGNAENKRLRGFFRKATRFIERTTSINAVSDDNKLLIGGMAINLK